MNESNQTKTIELRNEVYNLIEEIKKVNRETPDAGFELSTNALLESTLKIALQSAVTVQNYFARKNKEANNE
jgi:hypothetical protein